LVLKGIRGSTGKKERHQTEGKKGRQGGGAPYVGGKRGGGPSHVARPGRKGGQDLLAGDRVSEVRVKKNSQKGGEEDG